jgi:MFS transporter, DHA1 family, multidrug resistance protein
MKAAVPSLFILILISAVGPFGDTEYTPALPSIAKGLGVSYSDAQLTMTFYLVGYSFSQLCYGPLSDRWGRRPFMIIGSLFFLGGSVACMLSEDLSLLIMGRVIQSVGSCAGGVLASAVVRDAFPEKQRAGMYAKINAAMAVAPGLGPVAGSFIDNAFGWHANFLLLVILGLAMAISVFFAFPETNHNLDATATRLKPLFSHFGRLAKHRTYFPYCIVAGFCMGLIYAILVEAPALVVQVCHLPSTYLAIVGVAVMFGFVVGSLFCTRLTRRFDENQLISIGLGVMILGCLSLTLLVVANIINFPSLLSPIVVIFVGIAFVVPNTAAKALAPFEKIAGIASSVMGSIQMGLAAVGTMLMGFWHKDGAVHGVVYNFWCLTLAATFVFVVFIALPGRNRCKTTTGKHHPLLAVGAMFNGAMRSATHWHKHHDEPDCHDPDCPDPDCHDSDSDSPDSLDGAGSESPRDDDKKS